MPRTTCAFAVATLCVLAPAAPTFAEEPRYPVPVIERLGKLPFELTKAKKTDAEIADAIFLAALVRLPTDGERRKCVDHIATKHEKDKEKGRVEAIQDLTWALINTKEFMKLHGIDKDLNATLVWYNDKVNELWGKAAKEAKEAKDEKKPEK